jgi:hypothetical protein
MSNPNSAAAVTKKEAPVAAPEKTKPPRKGPGRPPPGGSPEARRQATAILEVLAGVRSPAGAAGALGVSVPRYYALELQAMEGLLSACEPRRRGPGSSPEKEVSRLRREVQRLEGELDRSRALARATRRSVGLSAPPERAGGGKRRRRNQVRALKMAKRLAAAPEPPEITLPPTEGSAGGG